MIDVLQLSLQVIRHGTLNLGIEKDIRGKYHNALFNEWVTAGGVNI